MFAVVYVAATICITVYSVQCSLLCKEGLGRGGCALLPSDEQCGKSRSPPRVVGGVDASLGQFPWTTFLFSSPSKFLRDRPEKLKMGDLYRKTYNPLTRLKQRLSKFPLCGGSLISDRFIVSAAHCCLSGSDNSLVSVRVGEHDLGSAVDCESGICAPPPQDIPVDKYVAHELYDPLKLVHDICLIRLQRPVKFNEFATPICLPTSHELQTKDLNGTYLEVAGWGIMKYDGLSWTRAMVLQTTSLPVTSRCECERVYGSQVAEAPQLCAGGEGHRDSCNGDSGGPLMGRVAGGSRYYLLGVVSYGEAVCSGDLPGVYVDVTKYVGWIVDTMERMENGSIATS